MQGASNPVKLPLLERDELINPRGFLNVLLGNDCFTTLPDEILGSIRNRSSGRSIRGVAPLGYIMEQSIKPVELTGEVLSVDEIRAVRKELRHQVAEILENAREVTRCLSDVRYQWINYQN